MGRDIGRGDRHRDGASDPFRIGVSHFGGEGGLRGGAGQIVTEVRAERRHAHGRTVAVGALGFEEFVGGAVPVVAGSDAVQEFEGARAVAAGEVHAVCERFGQGVLVDLSESV